MLWTLNGNKSLQLVQHLEQSLRPEEWRLLWKPVYGGNFLVSTYFWPCSVTAVSLGVGWEMKDKERDNEVSRAWEGERQSNAERERRLVSLRLTDLRFEVDLLHSLLFVTDWPQISFTSLLLMKLWELAHQLIKLVTGSCNSSQNHVASLYLCYRRRDVVLWSCSSSRTHQRFESVTWSVPEIQVTTQWFFSTRSQSERFYGPEAVSVWKLKLVQNGGLSPPVSFISLQQKEMLLD